MLWLRKSFLPQVLKIILLLFVVASMTVDNSTAPTASPGKTPALRQALCSDDPGDFERHPWKIPKYAFKGYHDTDLPGRVIKTYVDQAAGIAIPAPPAMFFQPDRAPPVSL